MTEPSSLDPTDRAVELMRALDARKTDAPLCAEPMERFVSRLIDLGLLLALFIVLATVAGAVDWGLSSEREDGTGESHPVGAAFGYGATVLFALAVVVNELAAGGTGQTLGKKLYSLTVVDATTGRPPGVLRAAMRTGAWLVPLVLFASLWGATFPDSSSLLFFAAMWLSLITPLWMFLDRDHRGLHDILAHTIVRRPR